MLQPINLNVTSATKLIQIPLPPLQLEELKSASIYPLEAAAAKRSLNLIKNLLQNSSQLNGRPQTIRRFYPVCGIWLTGIEKKRMV